MYIGQTGRISGTRIKEYPKIISFDSPYVIQQLENHQMFDNTNIGKKTLEKRNKGRKSLGKKE